MSVAICRLSRRLFSKSAVGLFGVPKFFPHCHCLESSALSYYSNSIGDKEESEDLRYRTYKGAKTLNPTSIVKLVWQNVLEETIPITTSLVSEEKHKDILIDATCGNGQDAQYLAETFLNSRKGTIKLYCIDIQKEAIERTKKRIAEVMPPDVIKEDIEFIVSSHESFPGGISENTVSLVCYNLGYLPGSGVNVNSIGQPTDFLRYSQGKTNSNIIDVPMPIKTETVTTIKSIKAAIPLLKIG